MKQQIYPKCQHCGQPFAGNAYWVTSKEGSILFLDMAVCNMCYLDATELGLDTEKSLSTGRRSSNAVKHFTTGKVLLTVWQYDKLFVHDRY